ncbi:MAG: AtpZ/AtpI family protein [Ktedonobacterales bacterium]
MKHDDIHNNIQRDKPAATGSETPNTPDGSGVNASGIQRDNGRNRLSKSNTAVFALVGQVGLSIALGAVLGAMLGVFIDSKLHTSPIATLIGLLLGLAAGIYSVYRLISSVL